MNSISIVGELLSLSDCFRETENDDLNGSVQVVTATILPSYEVSQEEFTNALRAFYSEALSNVGSNIHFFAEVCLNLSDWRLSAAQALHEKFLSTVDDVSLGDFDAACTYAFSSIFRDIESMTIEARIQLLKSCSNEWVSKLDSQTRSHYEEFVSS